MTKFTKRSLAFAIALVMCLSLFSVFALNISAASTTSSGTVNYKYSGKYIYNWGEREEDATFLSPKAIEFYAKYNVTYELLAGYTGGTSKSNVPSSQMYKELASLMKKAQTHVTNYDETKSLYQYTDCENNGSVISSFYSGVDIGPSWDGGKTWNREHTWPNSKGSGSSENDIMMLRPTSMRENSGRGNTAYGESSSYYNPNKESGGKHDLRGDVARIFLYVYVRWGDENRNNAWGASGVMESPEVMLEWMEIDPVDTWELGRNDSVQAITGTRNVFVDYPELAFLMFGEDIPEDYTSPSGKGATTVKPSDCDHEYDNDCDTTCAICGYVRVITHTYSYGCDTTCNVCGFVREANGHIYSFYCDATCNNCGFERTAEHIYTGWQTVKEATETEAGLEKGSCYYCKVETKREIPKLSSPTDKPTTPPENEPTKPSEPTEVDCANGKHAFSAWEENKDGVKERYCNECGFVELETDKPETSEHSFTEWEVNKDGVKERFCTECGFVETEGNTSQGANGNSGNSGTSSSTSTDGGFFAKIADFFKNIFAKLLSIFKKN